MQKETHKFHIGIKIYKKEFICEQTILLKAVGLSGFIHVEKVRFIIDFLSVAPQPMQITFFRAHDDHVMCVDIETHVLILHSPANQENKIKSITNGLSASNVSVKFD